MAVDLDRREFRQEAATGHKVIDLYPLFVRVKDDGITALDIGRRDANPDFSAVEQAEIDQGPQALLHRRQVVKTAKPKRVHGRNSGVEMSRAPYEPGANSAHPAREMPEGDGGVALHRRKIPEGLKPAHPVGAAIAGNEGGR